MGDVAYREASLASRAVTMQLKGLGARVTHEQVEQALSRAGFTLLRRPYPTKHKGERT